MNTSVIRYRVADFLKRHAPFDALPEPELLELAASGRVKFHESDEYILKQGQAVGPFVWVIQQGRVDMLEESPTGELLRDVAGEGDLLGVERFFGHSSWLHSARTTNDVILYSIDARRLEEMVARFPALQAHLAAHFTISGDAAAGRASWLDAEAPPLDFLRARTGAVPAEIPVIPAGSGTRAYIRRMVETRAESLAIVSEGSTLAVITASDLALFCDRNPAQLLREIRDAESPAVLAPLVKQATRMVRESLGRFCDVDECCLLATELVAAAAQPVIRFAEDDARDAGLEAPEARACWIAFGALARGEAARPELPAVGVVFDDSAAESGAWFATVAGQTAAGFDACGMTGEGFLWPQGAHPCMPLSEWQRFFRQTIRHPMEYDLFARRELFDIRALSGDRSLAAALHLTMSRELEADGMMIPLLANDTLADLPPLAFFRGLVLDSDGTERSGFDLLRAAIHPIAGAARVLALWHGRASCTGTLDRLAAAAADFPQDAPIFRDAAQAFRIATFHLATQGAHVEPAKLSRYDQRLLKTAFASILRLLEFTASSLTAAA